MNKNTKNFFDNLSKNYSKRYSLKDKRSIFFNERLNFSLQNEDLQSKSILDIGAGNGMIYKKTINQNVNYYACDISEEMMKNGGIPKKSRFPIYSKFPDELYSEKFDYIFILGLTAYLTKNEFDQYLEIVKHCSKNGTRIIISYTLKNIIHESITNTLRIIYQIFANKFYKNKELIISSKININRTKAQECFQISKNFLTYDYLYHNFIPAPFDRLFPYSILKFLNYIFRNIFGSNRIKFMATDLIVKYQYAK